MSLEHLLLRVRQLEDDRIWHSGVNINFARDGSCEVNAWWPDPSKDDSSPGYVPHISEVRATGETVEEALRNFIDKAARLENDYRGGASQ